MPKPISLETKSKTAAAKEPIQVAQQTWTKAEIRTLFYRGNVVPHLYSELILN